MRPSTSFAALAQDSQTGSVSFDEVPQSLPSRKPFAHAFTPTDIDLPKIGSPTYYEEEYCQAVFNDMAQGYSLTAFGASIGVTRQTLNEWQASFPPFGDAVRRAKAARQRFWESKGIYIGETGGTGGQATMTIFMMKNMDNGTDNQDFKEKQEVAHSGQVTLAALVESSLRTISPPAGQTIEGEATSEV